MKLFKIHTEENGKDVNFGIHGVYADNEEDAIKYTETEIVANFLSMGYKVEVGRMSKRSVIYGIIYVWDNEDTKYRKIIIWAIEKEKKKTINKVKSKEQKMIVEKTIELMKNEKRCIIKADTCEWIPCSKQLPKVNKYYLVQNEYGDMLVAKYIKKDCWEEIYSRHKLGATDKIVAWMPLPKKYKTEMEKKR